jgi:hypothetical protein
MTSPEDLETLNKFEEVVGRGKMTEDIKKYMARKVREERNEN